MRLLTWNVDGVDHKRIGARMEKLCVELFLGGDLRAALDGRTLPPMPEVLGFQEMTRHAHGALKQHLRAAGFTTWPSEPLDDREDYRMVAVRAPWSLLECEDRPFSDSPLRRGCLVAELDGPFRCRFITGHLESLRSGRDARIAQAREIDAWLHESATPAIFGGDTNLRQGEWAVIRRGFRARDAFHLAGEPREHAATWWPENGPPGYRFDRFWLTAQWQLESFRRRRAIGASDHAGIEIAVSL